ncbi:hypothetical protein ABK040_002501 [Willaertia magna]
MSKHNLSIGGDINSDYYDESIKRRKFVSSDMINDQDMDTDETNSLLNARMQSIDILSNPPLPDILVNTVKNITYKKISNLSSGGNGIVALYQTIDLNNPCKVVIKRIDNDIASSETDIDLINNKFSKLHSKHIIQCKDYFEMDGYFYFVMDYCGYNLREYILHKGTKIITPFFILQLIIQIITALNYLNEQQLFHGDLKLENIFVSEELNEILKDEAGYFYGYVFILGDLGSVNEGNRFIISNSNYSNINYKSYSNISTFGTIGYQAPELMNGNCLLTEKIDIWSLGITLLILLSLLDNFNNNDIILNARKYLFEKLSSEQEYEQYFNNILTHIDNTLNEIINTLGNNNDWKFIINNIITSMLDKNPNTRISCKEVYKRLFPKGREFKSLRYNFFQLTKDLCDCSINLFIETVSVFKRNLNFIPTFLKDINDRNVVLKIVSAVGYLLEYCLDCFKNDKEIILAAISSYPNYYSEYLDNGLEYDKDIALFAILGDVFIWNDLPKELLNDKEFFIKYIQKLKEKYPNINVPLNSFKDCENILKEISEKEYIDFRYNISLEQLLNDEEYYFELCDIKKFLNIPSSLKYNKIFIKEMINRKDSEYYYNKYIPNELKEDKEFTLELLKLQPSLYSHITNEFKKDKEIILTIFRYAYSGVSFNYNFWKNEYLIIDIINTRKDLKLIVSEFDTHKYMIEVLSKLLFNNSFELLYTSYDSKKIIHKESYFKKYYSTKFWFIKCRDECIEFVEINTFNDVHNFNKLFFELLKGFSKEKSAEPLPDEELNDMNKKQLRLEQKSNIKDTPIFFEISENSFICIETDCNIIEYNDDEVFGEPKKLCNCEEEESNDAPITGCGLVNQQYFIELLSTCQMKYKCNCNYINYHSIVPETLGIKMRRYKTEIYLNVYDLTDNSQFYPVGLGFYHSGLEINGTEYTFGREGTFQHEAKKAPSVPLRESILLSTIELNREKLKSIIDQVSLEYNKLKYHILKRNCNHYAKALYDKIIENSTINIQQSSKSIPKYINRMAWLGTKCSCFVPPEILNANVPSSASGTEGGGDTDDDVNDNNTSRFSAFTGTGKSLSGNIVVKDNNSKGLFGSFKNMFNGSSGSKDSSGNDGSVVKIETDSDDHSEEELLSRREKMLQAAERRLAVASSNANSGSGGKNTLSE